MCIHMNELCKKGAFDILPTFSCPKGIRVGVGENVFQNKWLPISVINVQAHLHVCNHSYSLKSIAMQNSCCVTCVGIVLILFFSHSQALQTLHSVKELVSEMQSSLETLKKDLSSTSQCSSSLLKELTAKSCKLERLRAISGEGGVVYSAMKMVSEQKRLMSENEEDDNELLAIFYDRLPRKSSRIDALIEKAKSQVEEAEREERDTKVAMMKTKEKV